MARPLRVEYPGALYHITSRGIEQNPIFRSPSDNEEFLKILTTIKKRFEWICHAFVLMTNHYHFLIETPDANLSRGMRQINSIYSQFFNKKYNRVGHLFQGRYKSIIVEKEAYLLELVRYISLNPVRAGLVQNPEEWKWSSYAATIGKVLKTENLSVDWILSQFGETRERSIEEYIRFVKKGYDTKFPDEELSSQVILGSDKFVKEIKNRIAGDRPIDMFEIPSLQRNYSRASLEEIFQLNARQGQPRDKIIHSAYIKYKFSMKEIAEYLGIHYATVSRAIKRIESK